MKSCACCQLEKSLSSFGKNRGTKDGLNAYCKECHNEKSRKWHRKNSDTRRRIGKIWRDNNQGYGRAWHLKDRYGMTEGQYEALFNSQSGVCAICKGAGNREGGVLVVDHDHLTGQVRGLLCDPCNAALEMFKDSAENLTEAIRYLAGVGR